MEMPRDKDQKKEGISLDGNVTWKWRKRPYERFFSSKIALCVSVSSFFHFFQVQDCYVIHAWLTTLLLRWTGQFVPIMWTLEDHMTDLNNFVGPKMTPTTGMLNLKCSWETTSKIWWKSDWWKTLKRERRISTSSCDWGISWSLQQKSYVEKITCLQCWYQQCTKTWRNNSNWLLKWLT